MCVSVLCIACCVLNLSVKASIHKGTAPRFFVSSGDWEIANMLEKELADEISADEIDDETSEGEELEECAYTKTKRLCLYVCACVRLCGCALVRF